MTADEFRTLALRCPEAVEGSHMGHADFRVGKKIFASLGPDEDWGMVKLPLNEQAMFVRTSPAIFEPFNGAWGRQGATKVYLANAQEATVGQALVMAWRNVAPKRLTQ